MSSAHVASLFYFDGVAGIEGGRRGETLRTTTPARRLAMKLLFLFPISLLIKQVGYLS